MVRAPHHDSEHGRRVRVKLRVSLPSIVLGVVSHALREPQGPEPVESVEPQANSEFAFDKEVSPWSGVYPSVLFVLTQGTTLRTTFLPVERRNRE